LLKAPTGSATVYTESGHTAAGSSQVARRRYTAAGSTQIGRSGGTAVRSTAVGGSGHTAPQISHSTVRA
jgi:hypothetical protein